MRLSVKEFVKKSIDDYPKKKRIEWILHHPAQAVLNISQLYWTQEAEEAMRKGGNEGLAKYRDQLDGQIQDVVELVRGKLTKKERVKIGALTVIDVHARDVVDKMVLKGVKGATEFDWEA